MRLGRRLSVALCCTLVACGSATPRSDHQSAPPSSPVRAARAGYFALVKAFNDKDQKAFLARHAWPYCYYDTRLAAATDLPRAYAKHFEGGASEGPWIDPWLVPLSESPESVVFLQTEVWMSSRGDTRRSFELLEMRDVGGTWKLVATVTRAKRGCAPGLLKDVADARLDLLKKNLARPRLVPVRPLDADYPELPAAASPSMAELARLVPSGDRTLLNSEGTKLRRLSLDLDGLDPAEIVVTADPEPLGGATDDEQQSVLWVFGRSTASWRLVARKGFYLDPLSDGYYSDTPGIRIAAVAGKTAVAAMLRVDHVVMRGGMDPRYFGREVGLYRLIGGKLTAVFQCEFEHERVISLVAKWDTHGGAQR